MAASDSGDGPGVGVGELVGVGVGVGVLVGALVGVGVGELVGMGVGVGVLVGALVGVGVGELVSVGVGVLVDVGLTVGGVSVAVGTVSCDSSPHEDKKTSARNSEAANTRSRTAPLSIFDLSRTIIRDFPYWQSPGSRGSPNEMVAS